MLFGVVVQTSNKRRRTGGSIKVRYPSIWWQMNPSASPHLVGCVRHQAEPAKRPRKASRSRRRSKATLSVAPVMKGSLRVRLGSHR